MTLNAGSKLGPYKSGAPCEPPRDTSRVVGNLEGIYEMCMGSNLRGQIIFGMASPGVVQER